MSRPRKWILGIAGGLIVLAAALAAGGWAVFRSAWFAEKIRQRIVLEVEKATGGRVELGAFGFDPRTLTARVERFVLHGKEPPDKRPFFQAARVEVGLKIVSALRRKVDLAQGDVDGFELHIYVAPDGSNNIPTPAVPSQTRKTIAERVIDLAVRRFNLTNGLVEVDERKIPLNVRGERLEVVMDYRAANQDGDAHYSGKLAALPFWFETPGIDPLPFHAAVNFDLERDRVVIPSALLAMKDTRIQAAGTVENLRDPLARFLVEADARLADVVQPLHLPVERVGTARFSGKAQLGQGPLRLEGSLRGSGLAYRRGRVNIRNATLDSEVNLEGNELNVGRMRLLALGGEFRGRASLREFRRFEIRGDATGFPVAKFGEMQGARLAWNGTASGPVEVRGSIVRGSLGGIRVDARMTIAPEAGAVPLQGVVEFGYDQQKDTISLGNTQLTTPYTKISATGQVGAVLAVHAETTDLNDVLPLIGIVSDNPPESLPVTLQNGSAQFDGSVTGPLSEPAVSGKVAATSFEFEKRHFDRMNAEIRLERTGLQVRNAALAQNGMRVEGQGDLGMTDFKPLDSSPVSARLVLKDGDIAKLLKEAGSTLPVSGTVAGEAALSGTFGAPEAEATLTGARIAAWEEKFDRLQARLRYAGGGIDVVQGNVDAGKARLAFTGGYSHAAGDWSNGTVRFDVIGTGVTLGQSETVKKARPGIEGNVQLKAAGTGRVVKGAFELASLDGTVAAGSLSLSGKPTGNLTATAETKGAQLAVRVLGDLRGSKIDGGGEFELSGDYAGKMRLRFSPIAFSTVYDLVPGTREPLPFDGRAEGNAAVAGPLLKPESMKGRIELTKVEVFPASSAARTLTPAQTSELTLRNVAPVVFDVDGRAIRVRSLVLSGQGTQLEAAGAFSYQAKTPWDLRMSGTLNLATLRTFKSDILASGSSAIEAAVRGSADKPVLTGRLELKNASLYVEDIPNGVDNANGVIQFDANRATIEKLTAQTGGGNLNVTGFVGFSSEETTYRLQAKLERVRVRYPEGVSTTLDGNLALGGTTARSLLTGTLTIVRLGFNPRTDIGSLLAESAKPGPAPAATNPFLQGMQFDMRIETAPNVEFQTTLTRDVEAEADLRLRGSPLRPVLLGRVNVTQGEINFFGNKYTISHGEISFYNPAKIEPVLNLDLESRVRGVVVTLHFAGPVSKMNVSYRSDPPLSSQEIVALLAVGRAPDTTSVGGGQVIANQSFLQQGTNSLLGQALAAPVSSRLQRFFGVSRLKIDPQLTTLENTPQARLTIEQQISSDITLTYITNLANTQQQIVRLEWNMNKNWSVVAVREENGLFGIDFLYKKRFK